MFKYIYFINVEIIFILLTYLDATTQQRTFHKNTLKSKPNFFDKNNLKIHTIINNLMLSLKLDEHVSESEQFRMLQKKHSYFNSLSKNYCKVYDKLKNIIDKTYGIVSKKNFSELLPEVVKETFNIITNDVIRFANKTNTTEFTNDFIKNNTEFSQERFFEMFLRLNENSSKIMTNKKRIYSIGPRDPYDKTVRETETAQGLLEDTMFKLSDKTMEHNIDLEIIDRNTVPNKRKLLPISVKKRSKLKTWHSKIKENPTRRIYMGRETKIKHYPFVASLHFMEEFVCVGSIISADSVLTAASCLQTTYNSKLYRYNPRSILVRVGSAHTKRSGKVIPVTRVMVHPDYDTATLEHNLAIVQVADDLRHVKKRNVMRIKYNRDATLLAKNIKDITILGWGARDVIDQFYPFQRLTVANLDIYDINKCKQIYSKYYVTDTNFCAGFTAKGGGACVGDVGGPAVFADELVGVVSFGPSVCGMADAPTVLTDLHYYTQWIDGVVDKKPLENKTNTKTTKQTLHKTSSFVSLPVNTTESNTRSVSNTIPPAVRNAMDETNIEKPSAQLNKTDDLKGMEVLKKLMKELIVDDRAVVEYLSNTRLHNDVPESVTENISTNKDKSSLDPTRYVIKRTHTNSLADDKTNQSNIISIMAQDSENSDDKSEWNVSDFLHKYSRSLSVTETTEYQADYIGEPTKLATFIESSDFPDDIFSEELVQKLLILDDKSTDSLEIAIDDTPFIRNRSKKTVAKATNNNNKITTSEQQNNSESDSVNDSSLADVYHESNSKGKFNINYMSSKDSQTIGTTENLFKNANCGKPTKLTTTPESRGEESTSLEDSIETNNKHYFNI